MIIGSRKAVLGGLQFFNPADENFTVTLADTDETDSHARTDLRIDYFTHGMKALPLVNKLDCNCGPRRKLTLRSDVASAQTDVGGFRSKRDMRRRIGGQDDCDKR